MQTRSLIEHSASPVGTAPRVPLTFAEYFAGIGLFRMGLESLGWQCVYANDWSSERAQIYEGFFGERYDVKDIFSVPSSLVTQNTTTNNDIHFLCLQDGNGWPSPCC